MKLNKFHIFLIILFTLIVCCSLGKSYMEGYENNNQNLQNGAVENVTYATYTGPDGYNANIESVTIGDSQDSSNNNDNSTFFKRRHDRFRDRKHWDNYNNDYNNDSNQANEKYHDYSKAYNGNNHLYKYKHSVKQGKMNGAMFNDNDNDNDNNYNNDNSQGIPRSQIPKGQEDLYILKSEIVPPVCPACPTVECSGACNSEKKCPPCPPCARCPEPQFECKKVPSYSSLGNTGNLPLPFMADFSKFG